MLLTVTAHHDTHSLDMNQLTRCSAMHLEHEEIYESFAVARTCRRGILQAGFGVIDVSFSGQQLEIALRLLRGHQAGARGKSLVVKRLTHCHNSRSREWMQMHSRR